MISEAAINIDDDLPSVSVLLPVRNEARFIETLIEQLLGQDYPQEKVEILIADGMSDDGTREILSQLCACYPKVRLIDNPERIVATGLNRLIQNANGNVLMRIDGHMSVPKDYVRINVGLLMEHPEAWGVGGPIVHVGGNIFANSVAAAMSTPLVMGFASHRLAEFEGYGEGAAFWTFHKWVFERVGLFDEKLVRTEDDEFNYRVTQAGGRFYLSPKSKSLYFVRDSVRKVALQFFQYSFWRIPVMKKHRRPTTVRQIVPLAFFALIAILVIVGLALGSIWTTFLLPVFYFAVITLVSIASVPKVGFKSAALLPLVIVVIHVSYAWGMLVGIWASYFRPGWFDIHGTMTRISR